MIRAGFWQKVRARGLAGIVKAAYRRAFDNPHSYLKRVTGIIHVGANLGQERELYAKYKLKVLWIEPLPHIFEKLRENIRGFPDQIAINHLITRRRILISCREKGLRRQFWSLRSTRTFGRRFAKYRS